MLSDEPLVASSIALTNAPSSAPSSATSNGPFSYLIIHECLFVLQGAPSSATLSPPSSVPSSASSGSPLDKLFCELLRIDEFTNKCNRGATQVQPQMHPSVQLQVQPQMHLLVCLYYAYC